MRGPNGLRFNRNRQSSSCRIFALQSGLGTSFHKITLPASFVTRNEARIAGSARLGKLRRRWHTNPGDLDGRLSPQRRGYELVSGRIIERYWV